MSTPREPSAEAFAELEHRLAVLEERQAIVDLYTYYAWLQDSDQWSDIAADIFTEDGELDLGAAAEPKRGRDEIHRAMQIREVLEGTAHYITNINIERQDAVHATVRAYFQSFHWSREKSTEGPMRPVEMVGVGCYLDELLRTENGWRIRRRRRRNLGPGPLGFGAIPTSLGGFLRNWGGSPEELVDGQVHSAPSDVDHGS